MTGLWHWMFSYFSLLFDWPKTKHHPWLNKNASGHKHDQSRQKYYFLLCTSNNEFNHYKISSSFLQLLHHFCFKSITSPMKLYLKIVMDFQILGHTHYLWEADVSGRATWSHQCGVLCTRISKTWDGISQIWKWTLAIDISSWSWTCFGRLRKGIVYLTLLQHRSQFWHFPAQVVVISVPFKFSINLKL